MNQSPCADSRPTKRKKNKIKISIFKLSWAPGPREQIVCEVCRDSKVCEHTKQKRGSRNCKFLDFFGVFLQVCNNMRRKRGEQEINGEDLLVMK